MVTTLKLSDLTLTQRRIRSMIMMYRSIMDKKDPETGTTVHSHDFAIAKAAGKHWYEVSSAEQYLKQHSYLADITE